MRGRKSLFMFIRSLSLLFASGMAFVASAFPLLTYSTYLRDSFTAKAIATDASGNIYLAGDAIVDPATSQTTVLVIKLNPEASRYLYVRYLGGSVKDSASAITVDAAGNAYVAGYTESPDFPVTTGTHLGMSPGSTPRSFVAKFDASGGLVFSDLLGGSAGSIAQAVALAATGGILVTGMVSTAAGPEFPSTAGSYSIPNTLGHPYLLELDPTGKNVVFSATGIGGSAVALDPAGNIYVTGSTSLLDYPTTPGAYQTMFPVFQVCGAPPCSATFQGANQYVTKIDPTGSTLIYSTAVSGTGNTINGGLAVDVEGGVYLTGYAGPTYPYTVTPPAIPVGPVDSTFFFALPFLSKLDPAGKTLVFSAPVGGAAVQVDSQGAVYVSGGAGLGLAGTFGIPNNLPALANVPAPCLPHGDSIRSIAYVSKLDAASGDVLGSQFIGGSTLAASSLALSGSTVWVAGTTSLADFPVSPGAVTLPRLGPTPMPGAYLGAVDFSQPQPPPGTPQIFCMVDSANLAPVGAASRHQLLTIFGTALGPEVGIAAGVDSTKTLAGVTVSVDSLPAPLLYVSPTQINFAVPPVDSTQNFASIQLTANGQSASPRQLPLTDSNPSLFVDFDQAPITSLGPVVVALNEDGSPNSVGNPATLGSSISVFVNGLMTDPRSIPLPSQLSATNGWSATAIAPANPFILRVDLQVPSALVNGFSCATSSVCAASFTLYDIGFISGGQVVLGAQAFGGVVYLDQSR